MEFIKNLYVLCGGELMSPERSAQLRAQVREYEARKKKWAEEAKKEKTKAKESAEQKALNVALLKASQKPDHSQIKQLLEKGAMPTAQSEEGKTPLHEIIETLKKPEVLHIGGSVERLLEKGKNNLMDAQDNLGRTALHIAVGLGEKGLSVVKLLIEKGVNLGVGDKEGNTPLHTACMTSSNNAASIRELLKNQSNIINRRNEAGEIPLQLAIVHNREKEIIKTIVEYGADVNAIVSGEKNLRLIHLAAISGQNEIIEILYKTKTLDTVSHRAETLEIDAKDSEGFTAFHRVIELWSLGHDIMQPNWLEQRFFKVTNKLKSSSKKETWEMIAANLHKKGANVNTQNEYAENTPLHTISESSNRDGVLPIVLFLLGKGARKDMKNRDENRPFQYGVGWGLSPRILVELMDNLSDAPDARAVNKYLDTPLHYAVVLQDTGRREEMVNFLLDYNPSATCLNVIGVSPASLVKTVLDNHRASLRTPELMKMEDLKKTLQSKLEFSFLTIRSHANLPVLMFKTNNEFQLPDWLLVKAVRENDNYEQALKDKMFSDSEFTGVTDDTDAEIEDPEFGFVPVRHASGTTLKRNSY